MSKEMNSKQKGYIGLGAMAVLAAVTVFASDPIYKAIDSIGKPKPGEPIYTAGTYTGTAAGFGGEIAATVTVSETTIESVTLKGDGETPGIGTNALEALPAAITQSQSTAVDAVAGATISSDAIKLAVEAALAQAKGEAEIKETTAEKTEETTTEETKAEETTTEETEKETQAVVTNYSFTPGTYTGTAQGYGGEVKAVVTVSDSKIETVELTGDDETEGLGTKAIDKLPAIIVEKQSAQVDGIAGATVSSDAVTEAVNMALDQAMTGGEAKAADTSAADTNTFKAGTYHASADGYGGEITVTVTVSDTKIESIEVKGDDETEGIGTKAIDKLPAIMVENQSAQVDAIAGATVSSDAIVKAVEDALAQARS